MFREVIMARHWIGVSPALSLVRDQHDRPASAVHAARPVGGLRAAAEEDVAARRALDCRAGVLGDGQPAIGLGGAGLARHRPHGVDPDRRAVGREGGVDGHAALGRELNALGADGALGARILEEDVALVLAHHVARLRRIALQPVADGGPGRLLLRLKHAHLDQHVADGRVRPVVGAIEAEVHAAALGELDATAALDLDLEQRHWVLHVGDLQALALEDALLDLGARVVGLVGEIGRSPIDGHREQPRRRFAAAHVGLEVTGESARHLDDQRPEVVLEEGARGAIVARLHGAGRIADLLPLSRRDRLEAAVGGDLGVRAGRQFGAGAAERDQRLGMLVFGPAGDLIEGNRRHRDTLLVRRARAVGTSSQQTGRGKPSRDAGQDGPAHNRKSLPQPSLSVLTSSQFGSLDLVSRRNVQRSITFCTSLGLPSMIWPSALRSTLICSLTKRTVTLALVPCSSAAATSEASKPISVVSAFSLRSTRPRIAASKLEKVGPSSSPRRAAMSPLAKASTMAVKAARAPPVKPIGSKLGSAARMAATPAVAVGITVARMPPGPLVALDCRGAGALAVGSDTTLSLPWLAGASPTRGVAVGGGRGGDGEQPRRRWWSRGVARTGRNRKIKKTATSPIR